MSVKIENLENNQVKFEITIDSKTAEKAYNDIIKNYTKQVNIPGFRKGKAPHNVVEKYLGAERIKVQVVENLFPAEFHKAVSENKLDLAIQPEIESFTFDLGKDLIIVAHAEVKPEVELGQYKGLEIEYEGYKTPENAFEKELEAIQTRFSTIETINEDREATDKDIAVIDFEGFVDGKPIERGSGKAYALDLGHSNFIPGFAEGILGHKKGEEFTIDVTFPENYGEESLKGKPAQFKINLIKIRRRVLPELDDKLAKKAGKYDSIEALKEDIKKYIETSEKDENEKRQMEAVFKRVVDDAKIDIQETMIAREIQAVLAETKQAAEQQGQDWDKFLEAQGTANIENQAREEATKRIRNSLIIEKIAREEGIKIQQNDILEQVAAIAGAYQASADAVLKEVSQNSHFFTALTQQAAIKKVNDLLLQNNKFITKAV